MHTRSFSLWEEKEQGASAVKRLCLIQVDADSAPAGGSKTFQSEFNWKWALFYKSALKINEAEVRALQNIHSAQFWEHCERDINNNNKKKKAFRVKRKLNIIYLKV